MGYNKCWHVLISALLLFLTGCNFFNIEKIDREQVKESQLQEIRDSALENYPQINFCEENSNSKECFEHQLLAHLNESLAESSVDVYKNEVEKDTLWLIVHVTKDGEMGLKDQVVDAEFQQIITKIDSTLKALSPIEPAHTQGIKVSCNFKLPLVINKKVIE